METTKIFTALLNVPPTQWPHSVRLLAYSSGGTMLVNSFIAKVNGRKYYGFRKHEMTPDFTFTGKQWFEVEPMRN